MEIELLLILGFILYTVILFFIHPWLKYLIIGRNLKCLSCGKRLYPHPLRDARNKDRYICYNDNCYEKDLGYYNTFRGETQEKLYYIDR